MLGRSSARLAGIVAGALLIVALVPSAALADTAPTFTSGNTAVFTLGTPNTFLVTATGSPTPSISAAGSLPGGVTFVDNHNGTGTLSGTPTTSGTFAITFTASNTALPPAVQSFLLTVNSTGTGALFITSASSYTFPYGTSTSFLITTSGTPAATSITESGALPAGMTFTYNGNGTATLAGTPATIAVYYLTITATNGIATANQTFVLTVSGTGTLTIISASSYTFPYGTYGSFLVQASGTPAATNIYESGTLPSGLTFTYNNNGTATLAGITTTYGTYYLTFTATNGASTPAVQSFTLYVGSSGTLTFTSASSYTFPYNSYGSFLVTTSGTPAATYIYESGTLPSGLTFTYNNNGTATLAGITTTYGTYYLTFTASNGTSTPAVQSFVLTVGTTGALTFTSASSYTFPYNSYGSFLVTTSGTPAATYIYESGTLPSGLTFTYNNNGTATLAGITTTYGTYYLTFTASNGTSTPAVQSFVLTVGTTGAALTLTDAIAPGVNRGTSGFGTKSLVVKANGYVTILVVTSPNLAAGTIVTIWVKSKTVGWHQVTARAVASDGTVHYYARVNGWTGYLVKFAGNATYAAATSHGRIATNPS